MKKVYQWNWCILCILEHSKSFNILFSTPVYASADLSTISLKDKNLQKTKSGLIGIGFFV